jgi:hypothetical protein
MAQSTRTSSFNPAEVDVQVIAASGAKTMTGFGEGTFIEVTRDEDAFTKTTGANGEVTRTKRNNNGGKIVMTLLQGSQSNEDLSDLINIDENTGFGSFSIIVQDNSGGSVYTGSSAWILKHSDVTLSSGHEARVWTIDVAHLLMTTKGNTTI